MFIQWVLIITVFSLIIVVYHLKRKVSILESRTQDIGLNLEEQLEISIGNHIAELDQYAEGILNKVTEREKALYSLMSHVDNLLNCYTINQNHTNHSSKSNSIEDQPINGETPFKESLYFREKALPILQLAAEGLTTNDIAKRLGIGCGEVKMILDMERMTNRYFEV